MTTSPSSPSGDRLVAESAPFLHYLAMVAAQRPVASLSEVIARAGGPRQVAIVVVDVINGFCRSGALASPRVDAIVAPIVTLLEEAEAAGIEAVALLCDTHSPQAEEFHQFAPHCIAGTSEAEPVDELKALPHYRSFYQVHKNSVSPWHAPDDLAAWLHERLPGLSGPVGAHSDTLPTVIVVGDCTDLCAYQVAIPLKLAANQDNRPLRVIAPADCLQTYDLSIEAAAAVGALPHPGDLLHSLALYSMALNGIEVVERLVDSGATTMSSTARA